MNNSDLREACAKLVEQFPVQIHTGGPDAASRSCKPSTFEDVAAAIRAMEIAPSHPVITIHWGNKPAYNRHKVALEVQDAVNLRALAREFVKVVDQAMEETRDTGKTWDDPAVVLFVNKFESLCRSDARFSTAYATCFEKAKSSLVAEAQEYSRALQYAPEEDALMDELESIQADNDKTEPGEHNG